MKIKIICLLAVLLIAALVASPNNYCVGVRCTEELQKQVTMPPAKKIVKMIDDVELLPIYQFLDKF